MHYIERTTNQDETFRINNGAKGKENRLYGSMLSIETTISTQRENDFNQTMV